MRYALKTAPENCAWADLLGMWQAADEIDLFESAWLSDHFEPVWQGRDKPVLEGWTALAALAQATTRIRVGMLVSAVPYRHPALLANMVGTLDHISGGRLEVGLGAGWHTIEADANGIDLLPLRDRMDRLDEAADVVIGLLTQPAFTFAGDHYKLTDARCEPKPLQRPHPPICIGGNGERRTLRTAARVADHWNYIGGSPEDFARRREILAAHCAAAGRDIAEITTSWQLQAGAEGPVDPAAVAAEAAAYEAAGADMAIIYLHAPHDPSVLGHLADALVPLAAVDAVAAPAE